MCDRGNAKTSQDHWETVWARPPRMRLPSPLNLGALNTKRLLRRHVKSGMRFLEVGCAPGKMLAWVAKVLRVEVAGLDNSERGMAHTRQLFDTLGIRADLRQEDFQSHTFERGSFDVVYSSGFIEHFADPRPTVRAHTELARPKGKVLIAIPNLTGWWGAPTRWLDPGILDMHNLDIMDAGALVSLAPNDLVIDARAYRAGRFSIQHAVPVRKLPGVVTRSAAYFGDLVGFLQPIELRSFAPLLVLEMTRRGMDEV